MKTITILTNIMMAGLRRFQSYAPEKISRI